jgi:hypothetical protein
VSKVIKGFPAYDYKLLPCWDCGEDPQLGHYKEARRFHIYIVHCQCGVSASQHDTPEEAIEAWNTHAQSICRAKEALEAADYIMDICAELGIEAWFDKGAPKGVWADRKAQWADAHNRVRKIRGQI